MDDWDDWGDSPNKASGSDRSLPVSSRVGGVAEEFRHLFPSFCLDFVSQRESDTHSTA